MLTTGQARVEWSPTCKNVRRTGWHAAYAALDACLHAFAYAPRKGVTGAQNCRPITGGSGYTLHAYFDDETFTFWNGLTIALALAVDINWDQNPYGPRLVTDMPRPMLDAIARIRTNSGAQVWRWGGSYSGNKDAMHFEILCTRADLATGIDPSTLPATSAHITQEDEPMAVFVTSDDPKNPHDDPTWFITDGFTRRPLAPGEPQTMVDLGLVKPGPDGKPSVKVLGPQQLARISLAD